MRVKAIPFDLDGTIFDILERDAFARYKALNELGYNVPLVEIRKHYRYGKDMPTLLKSSASNATRFFGSVPLALIKEDFSNSS